jgi:hypothetical protein
MKKEALFGSLRSVGSAQSLKLGCAGGTSSTRLAPLVLRSAFGRSGRVGRVRRNFMSGCVRRRSIFGGRQRVEGRSEKFRVGLVSGVNQGEGR